MQKKQTKSSSSQKSKNKNPLCPSQQKAYEVLIRLLPIANVIDFWGNSGRGVTTVLKELHREKGGSFLNMKEFLEAQSGSEKHPLRLEETFFEAVLAHLKRDEIVIVDDLYLLLDVVSAGCNHYPRQNFLNIPLKVLISYAIESKKKLILSSDGRLPWETKAMVYPDGIQSFQSVDYKFLCKQFLGTPKTKQLDYEKIYRFAPKLNAHQIQYVCTLLGHKKNITTEEFIQTLISSGLTSNVDLGEVQPVKLSDLKGLDEIIEALETNIILPFENDSLSQKMNLNPKRGILLAGPPGTGKTTIGRALAHRLKSKFFLIDGTVISGSYEFYNQIQRVFHKAKENAPSIIFIDDSDAIFEGSREYPLYRYLLTMLDGLESESMGKVCVIMTAMDVADLPPALIRSGRIELWLETKLPCEEARKEILSLHLEPLPTYLKKVDMNCLVQITEGFTGADLKRMVEDGKVYYVCDKARKKKPLSATKYFERAAKNVWENQQKYKEALVRSQSQWKGKSIPVEDNGWGAAFDEADQSIQQEQE